MTAPATAWQPDTAARPGKVLTVHPDGCVVVGRLPALRPILADTRPGDPARLGWQQIPLADRDTMWVSDVAQRGRTDLNLTAAALAHFGGHAGKVYGPATLAGPVDADGAPTGLADHRLRALRADATIIARVLDLPGAAPSRPGVDNPFSHHGIEV